LLLPDLAEAGGFLLLSLHAGLLVVLAPPCFREDAVLLDALIEALERCFEGFVFADDDLSQGRSPPCTNMRRPPAA